LHIEQTAWVIIAQPNLHPRKRRVNWIPNPEDGPLADSIREFYSKMRVFRADYDQLFHENIDRLITVGQKFKLFFIALILSAKTMKPESERNLNV
jgi:hypothetical protein